MYTDENDTQGWVVAWSGGKDSTAVLGLVTSAISMLPRGKRSRHIHVVMSDTRVENPVLSAYMLDQVQKFNKYAERFELPMKATIVARPIEHSYFVLTLGRGYFLPLRNGRGRWCTERLKIVPSNTLISDLKPSYKIVGTRTSESISRASSIDRHRISHKIAEDAASVDSKIFMPIVDWTDEDVWEYLGKNQLGWTSTGDVRQLYKEATGECGINNPKGVANKTQSWESCGARFGCWLCPVITSDRSTEEMAHTHSWLEPLTEWRNLQLIVYGQYTPIRPEGQSRKERSKVLRKWESINERNKIITKAGYNRAGKRMKDGQGTLTVEARRYLFDKLIETQALVNRLREYERLSPISLISDEEIALIKQTWADDERNYPHLITNAKGIPFTEFSTEKDGSNRQTPA